MKPDRDAALADAEQEIERSLQVPAVFANRFRVQVGHDVARITFAEAAAPNGHPHFRAAIIMPHAEAMELARVIQGLSAKLLEVSAAAAAVPDGKPN